MSRKGTWQILLGELLILAAIFLAGYNLLESEHAQKTADSVEHQLEEKVSAVSAENIDTETEKEMSVEVIDGNSYIGILEIPALELKLPILSEWSYPLLKIAPCRYRGSVYQNDMILLAHNYESHFGTLKNLDLGEKVSFYDVDGNAFHYEVAEVTILSPEALEEMESGDWDLTLFTCTVGGQSRVTVRCQRIE